MVLESDVTNERMSLIGGDTNGRLNSVGTCLSPSVPWSCQEDDTVGFVDTARRTRMLEGWCVLEISGSLIIIQLHVFLLPLDFPAVRRTGSTFACCDCYSQNAT
jgi:hypothetical protein